jgi:hypothetical protein
LYTWNATIGEEAVDYQNNNPRAKYTSCIAGKMADFLGIAMKKKICYY